MIHYTEFIANLFPELTSFSSFGLSQRGFSYGYDYYTPEKAACYHFYQRKDIPMVSRSVYCSSVVSLLKLKILFVPVLGKRGNLQRVWLSRDESAQLNNTHAA